MKKILLLVLQFSMFGLFAQTPPLINYQGIARDAKGVPYINDTISIRFEIRQGSGETLIFSEEQILSTNSLGLFSTQIGKMKPTQLDAINWENGPIVLQTAIDINAGTNYTDLGKQVLASVPYALQAKTVPSSLNSNSLTIGSQTHVLPQNSFTNGSGIAITSGSVITNSAPDVTITLQSGTNVNVSGTYPDFTVTATPTLNFNNDNLDISGGNTVSIAPTLSITGNILRVGPSSNSITLPSPGTPTIIGTGVANVTPLTGTNFTVDVATPTFTNNGPSTISGAYPNFTLNSPVTPSVNAAGIATVSTGPNYMVGVPAPNFNNVGPTTISGTYPNLTITSPTVPPSTTVTANSAGIATVSAGPNFTIGVQTPTFTNVGPTTISGNYPNLTITSPTVPPSTTVTANSAGIATVSAGPNFTIGVQTPTFTNVGPTTISGTYPNLTITSPTVPPTTTVVAAPGIATVSAGPNFTIGVQTPTYTNVGPTTITGTYPNLTITSPTVPPTTTVVAAPGIATVSAGPNFTIGVQTPTYTNVGPTTISGTYPNLTITSPTVPPTTTITANPAGIATVSAGPDFTIGVQPPNYTSAGITTISGTYPNLTVTSPSPVIVGTGATTVTATYPNYSINTATPNITGGGVTTVSGTFPNYVVTTPVPPQASVTATGLASVTPASGMSFTVDVPVLTFTPTTGLLASGINTVLIDPALSLSNNTLMVGSPINTLALPWAWNGNSVTLGDTADFVGIGTSTPIRKLEVSPGSNSLSDNQGQTSVFHNSGSGNALFAQSNDKGAISGATFIYADAMLAGYNSNTPFGLVDVGVWGIGRGITTSYGVIAQNGAPGAATTYVGLGGNTYSGIFIGGNVGIGTNAPTASLEVAGTVKIADGSQGAGKVLTSNASGDASWQAVPTWQVCYLKDVKGSGSTGGTFTSGSWITRVLNTVEGSASIVSLAGNQFTLQSGVYDIYAEAPAHNVNNNKIKLYNVTDNTDDIIGGYSQAVGIGNCVRATLMGRITITSAKIFAIQHRSSLTQLSDGFGSANSFGVSEVFTQVRITKIN